MRDLQRYARNIRNENRTTVSTGIGEPEPNEGVDGDIRINTTSGGIKLYAKYKSQWYSTGLSKVLGRPKKIGEVGISNGGTISNDVDDTTAGVKDDIASLASKINEILERLQ
jgi:hypothetical protein